MTTTDRFRLSDSALADLHRSELAPHVANRSELDRLTEEHRLEWVARIGGRAKNDLAAPVATEAPTAPQSPENGSKPQRVFVTGKSAPVAPQVPVAAKSGHCRDCGTEIIPTGRRGRPPVRCEKCQAKAAS